MPEDRARYFIDWMKPIALMRTTVGCPIAAPFCALWRIMDGRYYKREIDDVVAELTTIPEALRVPRGRRALRERPAHVALAERIEAAGIDKEYFAYSRIDSLLRDLDLMQRGADIGLRRLLFGIETVFDRELKAVQQAQKRSRSWTAVRIASGMGLGLFCGFIVNPSYTPEDFDELMRFIRTEGIDYPSFTVWTPIPGIADGGTDYSQVHARQPNGRPDWSQFDLQHATIPTHLPQDEFMQLYHSLWEVSHFAAAVPPEPLEPRPTPDESAEAFRNAALIKIARRVLSGY